MNYRKGRTIFNGSGIEIRFPTFDGVSGIIFCRSYRSSIPPNHSSVSRFVRGRIDASGFVVLAFRDVKRGRRIRSSATRRLSAVTLPRAGQRYTGYIWPRQCSREGVSRALARFPCIFVKAARRDEVCRARIDRLDLASRQVATVNGSA